MNAFQKAPHTVCIDHHHTNQGFAEYNHVEPNAGSAGEVVAFLFKEAGFIPTQDIADCLYNAIVADTGQFAFGGTTVQSLLMAAWLLENGARVEYINNQLFRTRTYVRTLLMGHALSSLIMLEGGKIGLISVPREVLEKCGATIADAENLVNFAVEVDTALVGILLMETGEYRYKCSLRSAGGVDVAEIATAFNGGGHKMAAGCTLYGTQEQAQKALLQKVREAIARV
jgi:phosphoesterase RecJ-like protein